MANTPKNKSGRTTQSKKDQLPDLSEVTSASDWSRSSKEQQKGKPLRVPSGKVCLVKKPDGLKFFLKGGRIPNALLPAVQDAVEGKGKKPSDLATMLQENPTMVEDILRMAADVTCHCVIQPKVEPVPTYTDGQYDEWRYTEDPELVGKEIPPDKRPDDDTLWVDYIDLEDQMFIFNYAVSGVTQVDQFRQGTIESMASLPSS